MKVVINKVMKISVMIVLLMSRISSSLFLIKAEEGGSGYTFSETFPDENLAQAVADSLGKTVNDQINQFDIDNTTFLWINQRGISDLSGIEHFINLDILDISNNQIKDINPLSNLINLSRLYIDNNQINDVSPLTNLINLEHLNSNSNQISNVSPLANLTNLYTLYLNNNQIKDINPLSNLISLGTLTLNANQVSDISYLENLTNLYNLELAENQISDISSVANLVNLEYLFLSGNHISDISPLVNITSLLELDLANQSIKLNTIDYSTPLIIQNTIINIAGELIAPNASSNNGIYIEPNIRFEGLSFDIVEVSYTFNQDVNLSYGASSFSGTVIQPIHKENIEQNNPTITDGTDQQNANKNDINPTKTGDATNSRQFISMSVLAIIGVVISYQCTKKQIIKEGKVFNK